MDEPPGWRHRARLAGARVVLSIVAMTMAYALLPFRDERWWVGALVGLVVIGAVLPFTVRSVRAVATADRPIIAAAEAVVLLLAMVIFGFAAVYLAIDRRAGQFDGIETRLDALYFTVVTLSTVGFGDIVPTGQTARFVVMLQVLFNLTLLAVAVRLLTNVAQRRRERVTGRD